MTSIAPAPNVVALFQSDAPVQKILEAAERSIDAAVRGPVRAETLIRAALLQISMTPALQKCDKLSIVQGVMQAASLGLLIGGPTGEAALVPRKGKAVLTPMVRGLVTLAMRSGSVLAVSPTAVYPGEKWKVYRGTRNEIEHEPDYDLDIREDDKTIRYVYAVFQMRGGAMHFDVMNRREVEKVRAGSSAKDDGPWVTHWGEMAKKTVVKRGSKMMELSPEFRAAVELDSRFETGQINEPSELLDSSSDITKHVTTTTAARTEELREKIKAQATTKIVPCTDCGGYGENRSGHHPECPHA